MQVRQAKKPGHLRIDNVSMIDRRYDFLFDTADRQMFYRESANIGEKFAPISDSSRYSQEVRKVVRKVALEFFTYNPSRMGSDVKRESTRILESFCTPSIGDEVI